MLYQLISHPHTTQRNKARKRKKKFNQAHPDIS